MPEPEFQHTPDIWEEIDKMANGKYSLPDYNVVTQLHAAAYGALIILLIDKGIVTREEYNRAYIQAQHVVSQEFARKRDEAQKENP